METEARAVSVSEKRNPKIEKRRRALKARLVSHKPCAPRGKVLQCAGKRLKCCAGRDFIPYCF
jgi:hypothetical protein